VKEGGAGLEEKASQLQGPIRGRVRTGGARITSSLDIDLKAATGLMQRTPRDANRKDGKVPRRCQHVATHGEKWRNGVKDSGAERQLRKKRGEKKTRNMQEESERAV